MVEPTRRDILKLACLVGASTAYGPLPAAAAAQPAALPVRPEPSARDKMTDRARRVMALAETEARHLHHQAVRPEDLLLGLAKEGHGVAGYVLRDLGAGYESLKRVLGSAGAACGGSPASSPIPLSPVTEAVLHWSWQECQALRHGYIGTEHLILGLTRLPNGPAVNALNALEVTRGAVRHGVLEVLGYRVEQVVAADRGGDNGSPG